MGRLAVWLVGAILLDAPIVPRSLLPRVVTVGTAVRIDAARTIRCAGGHYVVRFSPEADGLTGDDGWIRGVPVHPATIRATVVAHGPGGDSTSQQLSIVIFAAGLPVPRLPDSSYAYAAARLSLPNHYRFDVTGGALAEDNMPTGNATTDPGATLGRVLFYDPRLSRNDRVACASCHLQEFGFTDTARFSRGVDGARTVRHAMALANARFYRSGHFFRDERAATLEQQVLRPITDSIEMGLSLPALTLKLRLTPYYAPLFRAAFGTPEITSERVARALAQFVRSLVSTDSRLDSMYRGGGPPDSTRLTPQEREGRRLFIGRAGCSRCHRTNALNLDLPDNIGLDSVIVDSGAGGGRFKVSSLRNVAVRPPYMHDGRFNTLGEVVAFYDSGIRNNPQLDPRLRAPDGKPARLNLTPAQRDALVAYLGTFTDQRFLRDVRFSNPFVQR